MLGHKQQACIFHSCSSTCPPQSIFSSFMDNLPFLCFIQKLVTDPDTSTLQSLYFFSSVGSTFIQIVIFIRAKTFPVVKVFLAVIIVLCRNYLSVCVTLLLTQRDKIARFWVSDCIENISNTYLADPNFCAWTAFNLFAVLLS